MPAEKQLLSVEETAEILGISVRTIYNKIHRKSTETFPIPCKRIGRLVKFARNDIDKYLREKE